MFHAFTSITTNYLPKARVLAESIKRLHPDVLFHLVCSDSIHEIPSADLAVFDSVLTLEDLAIPNPMTWAFKHSVVEMCTAVKGAAARRILDQGGYDRIMYFDPDIVVLNSVDTLMAHLDHHAILLTPHLTTPEETTRAILDNEICAMRHGIYNLGFLAVKDGGEGKRFLDWWSSRLLQFCYDDIPSGLFTDQRWVDLAPGFFQGIGILQEPRYNVATWNLSHRLVSGKAPYELTVNGLPLCFYHFSGFDSGAQEIMLGVYGEHSPVLIELRNWYIAECERLGQSRYAGRRCVYDYFDNGEKITRSQRLLYRNRQDLRDAFPNPYATGKINSSYLAWYRANVDAVADAAESETARLKAEVDRLRSELQKTKDELHWIKNSAAWKLASALPALRAELSNRAA